MAKSLFQTPVLNVAELYGYPAGTRVVVFKTDDGEVHDIVGPDADPTVNYANAPNGSKYIPLTATAGSMKLWIKFGAAFGASNGTWEATAALT